MHTDPSSLLDAVVVGGSFAGLQAAMYIARGRRSVAVVDTGAPRNRFAAHSHGFFAHDGDAPLALMAAGRTKVQAYREVQWHGARAVDARIEAAERFAITLADGTVLRARRVVLAFGVVDELPPLPGLRERWGTSVLHCPYCHGHEFGGRPLGVLAGEKMPAHHAQLIAQWGPTTLFLNGHADRISADERAQLAGLEVKVEDAPVAALQGEAPDLHAVQLADGRAVPATALYVAPRTQPGCPLARALGCAMDEGMTGPIVRVDAMRMTTVPGVFAAGDLTQSMHSATLAAADGMMAGVSLHRSLVFGLPAP